MKRTKQTTFFTTPGCTTYLIPENLRPPAETKTYSFYSCGQLFPKAGPLTINATRDTVTIKPAPMQEIEVTIEWDE